jgi:cell division protein FtsZ
MESEESAKPRMGGLNSLISRMTGHNESQARERPQPPVESMREEAPAPMSQADADQERIEIPAFLRRQAN